MLIIEGPDCIGKTTLVNALIKRLGELNGGKEPGTDHFGLEDSALDTVDGYAPRIKPWTVSDRGWLSEVVYGEVLRGGSNVNKDMKYILDGMQAAVGGFTVLVWAKRNIYEELLDKHWTDKEAFGKYDLNKVALKFQEIAESPSLKAEGVMVSIPVCRNIGRDHIVYPTTEYIPPGQPHIIESITAKYLQLYCELGAPGVK